MLEFITLGICLANGAGIIYVLKYRPGPKGEDGYDGVDGMNGCKGELGPKGEKGDKGDDGDTGARGPQGVDGASGKSGRDGVDGMSGPAGPQGDVRYQMGGQPAAKCSQCGRLLVNSIHNPDGTVQCVDAAGCKRARETRGSK
jgi:hypothetical protein